MSAQKADTLKHHVTKQWTLSDDYTRVDTVPVDTAFSLYHRNKRAEKYSVFNIFPGNYGLGMYQLNFFDRVTDPDKFLYRNFYPLMHLPENAYFVNTQVPFTEMIFGYAGPRDKAEQTFRVRHSQNINRLINLGLVYDIVYSLGQYKYQKASDKTFAFHFSYTGNKYKTFFQAGINNIVTLENGGITDKSQLSSFQTGDVETNLGGLNKSQNTLKNWNILLVQRLSLNKQQSANTDTAGPDVTDKGARFNGLFSHILTFEKVRSSYYDYDPGSGFYDTNYVSSNLTSDTLSMHVLRNTLRFDFSTNEKRKFRLGGGFGIRNELFAYNQSTLGPITPVISSFNWNRSNNILLGTLYNNIGNKFSWVAAGELYLTGYRAGDFNVKGNITRDFDLKKGRAVWNITGGVSNLTPSDWYQHWYGNNFRWNNSFNKEFRINAGTEFLYPARRMALRFNYGIINNYTYFGADALPAQHSAGLSIASLMLKKELSAWKLHLHNEILVQVSSNKSVVDLPLLALRSAGFFEHNFHFKLTNGDLLTQIGVEVFYNTLYHGYAWMPATSAYYQQQSVSTGNYPYLNAFLNVKIKRTRIFVMLDHFNSGLSGYNYFLVPGNPMNVRCFRYGFAWTFYD
jgi:hypothetical protein